MALTTFTTQYEKQNAFERVLSDVLTRTPLLLFPVRLETHFRNRNSQKELCVRIFPNEIFLDYLTDSLTRQEIEDGKLFWLQWFIASGSPRREYEAWQVLCRKYPLYRAAWICRTMRPKEIDKFRPGGILYYRRPYQNLKGIDDACLSIKRHLSFIHIDEKHRIDPYTGEYIFERQIRKNIDDIKNQLSFIERELLTCKYIVDYLYDNVQGTVSYLRERLDAFLAFYEKYPYYADNARQMELWDVDYTMIRSFSAEVDDFISRMGKGRISLNEMIQKYLHDPKHNIFPGIKEKETEAPDMPVSHILPNRFMVIGEEAESKKIITWYGNEIPSNLEIGFNPTDETVELPYRIDGNGNLIVNGRCKWMVDYDEAERVGMAVTIPIDHRIQRFNYIYVLGFKQTDLGDLRHLIDLFNSHNYAYSRIEILKAGTPTNHVENGRKYMPVGYEDEMRQRYDAEVEDCYQSPTHNRSDARKIASILGFSDDDYRNSWGRVLKAERCEDENTRVAYKALWNYFRNKVKIKDRQLDRLLDFIGDFMVNHVRAKGNIASFRIDNLPYGILPVTDFLKLDDDLRNADPLLKGLNGFLVAMADEWKRLRKKRVVSSEELKGNDADRKYLEMAGQAPYSISHLKRAIIDSPLLPKESLELHPYLRRLEEVGHFYPWGISNLTEKEELTDLIGVVKKVLDKISDEDAVLLVREFLDLFTHRLDAWFSGELDYILNEQFGQQGRPVPKIGAFGWVFNLEENKRTVLKDSSEIISKMKIPARDSNESGNIYRMSGKDKAEFILAPSIQHALSACALRSAYLRTKNSDLDSHMCVNLSSMRARQALRILQGVRSGISTSALLGADLERYLHEAYRNGRYMEAEMDRYIYPLRKLFPLKVELETEDRRADNYSMQLIGGESVISSILDKWAYQESVSSWLEKNRNTLDWYVALHAETGIDTIHAHRVSLFKGIERLVDSYDALNDLLLSEGVHRFIQGDMDSFSAITKFMVDGNGSLPPASILDTPMEHVVVSHKVGVLMQHSENYIGTAFCAAEPSVDRWIEEMVGSLSTIFFCVQRCHEDGVLSWHKCSLAEIGMHPIEYLYLSEYETTFTRFIEAAWRLKNHCFREKVKVFWNFPEPISDKTGISLADTEFLISKLRSLILRSSAMKAKDWIPMPPNNSAGKNELKNDPDDEQSIDIEDLKLRYKYVLDLYKSLHLSMSHQILSLKSVRYIADTDLIKMWDSLVKCVSYGLVNSLPTYNPELSLVSEVEGVLIFKIDPVLQRIEFDKVAQKQLDFLSTFVVAAKSVENRIQQAENIVKITAQRASSSAEYIKALRVLTLDSFKIFPKFTMDLMLPDVKDRMACDALLQNGIGQYSNLDFDSFEDWQTEVSEVYGGMNLWHDVDMIRSALGMTTPSVSILQVKEGREIVGDEWLGCSVEDEGDLQNVDSIVLYGADTASKLYSRKGERQYNVGFVIDSWIEYIPYKKQTAGLAFHCDQPDNEAPQTLLLAIHPEFSKSSTSEHWKLKDVLGLLDTTRFMLMNRAVDPDMIYSDPYLSQFLPLLSNFELENLPPYFPITSCAFRPKKSLVGGRRFDIFDQFPGGNLLRN